MEITTIILPHYSIISWRYNTKIICSFTWKVCKFAIKRGSKNFSWSSQKNRTPSAKHLSQTPFFRFRLRASPVIESFLLKLKTITTCLEHDIFHNNLKGNIMDTSILTNTVAGCYQNRNTSQTFFVGIISPPKISANCPWRSQF